jgi:hypothetical protein
MSTRWVVVPADPKPLVDLLGGEFASGYCQERRSRLVDRQHPTRQESAERVNGCSFTNDPESAAVLDDLAAAYLVNVEGSGGGALHVQVLADAARRSVIAVAVRHQLAEITKTLVGVLGTVQRTGVIDPAIDCWSSQS